MKNESSIDIKEGYLLVKAKGTRSDFKDVIEGTLKINEAAKTFGINFILADYSEVHYDVPMADAFNLVKVYEKKLPLFSDIIISAVTNKSNIEIARFWESICIKRGYRYKVFTNYKKAEKWISEIIKESASN